MAKTNCSHFGSLVHRNLYSLVHFKSGPILPHSSPLLLQHPYRKRAGLQEEGGAFLLVFFDPPMSENRRKNNEEIPLRSTHFTLILGAVQHHGKQRGRDPFTHVIKFAVRKSNMNMKEITPCNTIQCYRFEVGIPETFPICPPLVKNSMTCVNGIST